MNCFCESGETNDLKIEGDVGADPIWCNRSGCDLDIEDIPISNELAEELRIAPYEKVGSESLYSVLLG